MGEDGDKFSCLFLKAISREIHVSSAIIFLLETRRMGTFTNEKLTTELALFQWFPLRLSLRLTLDIGKGIPSSMSRAFSKP